MGSPAWVTRTLRECAMPPQEIRAVLDAEDLETVRRHLELHREWLEERLAEHRRSLERVERSAEYLPSPEDPHPNYGYFGPEMSRRARALTAWASLRAYGRSGHRAMVERHLDLAQRLAARVDQELDPERLADVPLNVVCFRSRPAGLDEGDLDELNRRLGEAVIEDGRVYVGTTTYDGHVALRPAIVNWRTTERDVDALADVVTELGRKLARDR
jgi:glutamate/tyrosine decarboxylase-like PLP-dependent enzyme